MKPASIDFHVHCYPDKVAEKAIEAVSGFGLNVFTDGTITGLKQSMNKAGIDYSLNLPLVNSPETTRGVNTWAAKNNLAPVFSLGSIHPDDPTPDQTIAWIKSLGLKGIKMHPEYQDFKFEDSKLEPIWEACIKNDLFLLTHAGKDIGFEPPPNSCPESIAEFHRRYPELTLIAAHFGSWGLWEEVAEYLIGLPVYLDLSFVLGMIDDSILIDMIRKHGSEKVIFGTDSPWRDQKKSIEKFKSLELRKKEFDNIIFNNAARLLKLN